MRKPVLLTSLILALGLMALFCVNENYIPAVLCIAAVSAITAALLIKPKKKDSDPTGERFVSDLISMTDTISRATAERSCGIATEQLYEQARFAEPIASAEIRPLEREIMVAITKIHPTDSNEEITEKCEKISELLAKRERLC